MKVEEAVETRPPDWSIEKRVVVAPNPCLSLWMRNGEADWLVRVMSVRREEVVVVAAMVAWEVEGTVVVPIATQSELVVSLTVEPSSVHPEEAPVIAPQITMPEESVVSALEPEHDWRVAILAPPPLIVSPPWMVEVAVVVPTFNKFIVVEPIESTMNLCLPVFFKSRKFPAKELAPFPKSICNAEPV